MKEMILAHVEKAVLGICVLLLCIFLYGFFNVEPYKRTPEDFRTLAQKARKNVDAAEPNLETLKSEDFQVVVKELSSPIDPSPYFFRTKLRRPFDFGLMFRNKPEILQPSKPVCQSNRGLIAMFETKLEDGSRLTRKVKRSQSQFVKGELKTGAFDMDGGMFAGGRGRRRGGSYGQYTGSMMGPRGGRSGSGGEPGGDYGRYMGGQMGPPGAYPGGGSGYPGMAGGMMGGGRGAGDEDEGEFAGLGAMGLFGGNQFGGGAGAGMLSGSDDENYGAMSQPQPQTNLPTRRRRGILGNVREAKDEKKVDKKKEEELVEEYIVGMTGKHWVEIVASFPHAEQIKEYVKALREPAAFVGLRYALADVQRRELNAQNEWTNWSSIPLEEQFKIIGNAVDFEPEPFPQVMMKGLAMNIPMLQTWYKDFLTLPEFEKPEKAEYDPEFLNPMPKVKKGRMRRERPRRPGSESASKSKEGDGKIQKSSLGSFFEKSGNARIRLDLKGLNKDGKSEKAGEKFYNRFLVKNAMIRFWDFTVLPGRRYQYRVRVQTFNPNWGRNDVAAAELSSDPLLRGPWSEPSDDVYVEPDVEWYGIKQLNERDNNRASIQVQVWDRATGEWLVSDFTTQRVGDIIGLGSKRTIETVTWDNVTNTWKHQTLSADNKFDANTILLHIEGGRQRQRIGDREENFRLSRELIAVNAYGDLIRRDVESDINNEVRKKIERSYAELKEEFKPVEENPDDPFNEPRAGRGKGGKGGIE